MKKFGLLGRKLSHSYSPQIHSQLSNYEYKLYEKEPDELEAFMNNFSLDGMNVTIPYKKSVIPFCNFLSETALKIGSVNTIVKEEDGTLSGYNTDYYGFSYMIEKSGISVQNKKALILGSGGASLTVYAVLKDLNAKEVIVVSRSGKDNYSNIYNHYDAEVIVNTTPVGMFPKVEFSPLDLKPFSKCIGVLDLIYNPKQTMLIKQAQQLKIETENGLSMLAAQAKKSCELFLEEKLDDLLIDNIIKNFKI